MYEYTSTRRVNSVEFPGVSFVLRKMTEERRISLRQKQAEGLDKIAKIAREMAAIQREPEEVRDRQKLAELSDQWDFIQREEISPITLKWGLASMEGLSVDGRPATIDNYREWPSALFDEVLNMIAIEIGLNGAEEKNSESPTTSGAPVGGTPTSTSAPSVNDERGIAQGTVVDISRS